MKAIKLLTLALFITAFFQSPVLLAKQTHTDRQTRQVGEFHGISVSNGIDLFLSQKSTEEVVVEADSEDLNKIITEVEGGILKIYVKDKSFFNLNWNKHSRKVYVSFKTLDKLDASSGSDASSQSLLKLDKIKLYSSSGLGMKLEIEANELSAESSSGSDISLKGKAEVLQADASSGSDLNASEFQTKKCKASASSGSDVKLFVTEELEANASSGGNIQYSGDPKKKDINQSSGGDVHGN